MSILLYPNDHVSGVFEICDVIIISLEALGFFDLANGASAVPTRQQKQQQRARI
jgi:hypothetical protein